MLRLMGQLVSLACVATMLTLLLGVGIAWQQGKLNREKLLKIAAVVHDVDLASTSGNLAVKESDDQEQMSYDEQDRRRMIASKILDLKMQALDNGLSDLAFARRELESDVTNLDRRITSFKTALDEKQGLAKQEGYTNLRMIWEKMEPQRAKAHIMQMVEDSQLEEVIVLLSHMQNDKRAKIINEFSSNEGDKELEVLTEILDKIRRGDPEAALIDDTYSQLQNGGAAPNPTIEP